MKQKRGHETVSDDDQERNKLSDCPEGYAIIDERPVLSEAVLKHPQTMLLKLPAGVKLSDVKSIDRQNGTVYCSDDSSCTISKSKQDSGNELRLMMPGKNGQYKLTDHIPEMYTVRRDTVIPESKTDLEFDTHIPQLENMKMRFKPYGHGQGTITQKDAPRETKESRKRAHDDEKSLTLSSPSKKKHKHGKHKSKRKSQDE